MPSRRHSKTTRRSAKVNKTLHTYRGYIFTIRSTAAEQEFSVDFPDVPNIITSGVTLTEAFGNACEALDLYLESIQKLRMPKPKARHRMVVQSAS